jgi:hypothetical protein
MNSPLHTLTEAQLDQLYEWLLETPAREVAQKIALPAPDGFGIQTHVTTLRRFKDRRWAELAADQIESAAQLAGTHPAQQDTLDAGILSALKHHLFQIASSADVTDAQLALLGRWAQRQEKLKLDIQRVQIVRERLAQNDRRLQILDRSVQVREQESARRSNNPNSTLNTKNSPLASDSDALGPLARNWEDVRKRAQKKFGITPEESARRAELRRTWKNPNVQQSPGELPDLNTKTNIPTSRNDLHSGSNSEKSAAEQSPPLNLIDFLKDITIAIDAPGSDSSPSTTAPPDCS